jgi:DNA-binding CsgD family transcriptional regulator
VRTALTKLERHRLLASAHGLTAEKIASRYGTSDRAVAAALQSARTKLAARNGTHAVVLALQLGIITLEEIKEGLPE